MSTRIITMAVLALAVIPATAGASQQLSIGRAARVTRTAAHLVAEAEEASFSVYPSAFECVRLSRTLVQCPFEYGTENEQQEVTELCRDTAIVRVRGNGQVIYRTLSAPSCEGKGS